MIQDVRAYTTALSQSYAGRAGCAPTALSTCRVGSSSSSGGSVTISLTPFPTHADLEGELRRSAATSVQEEEAPGGNTTIGELMAWFKSGAFPTGSTGSGEILLLVAPPPQIPRTSSSSSSSSSGPSSIPFIGASVFNMSDINTSSKIVRYEGSRWIVVEGGGGSSAPLRPWAEQITMLTESIGAGRCSVRPTSSSPSGWEVVVESDSLVPGDVTRLRWYLPIRLTSTSTSPQQTTITAITTRSRLKFIQQIICSITLTLYPTVAVHNAKTNAELLRLQAVNAALVRELDEVRRAAARDTIPTDGARLVMHQAGRSGDEVLAGSNTNAGRGATGRDRHGGPQVVTSVPSQRGGKRSRGVKID